MTQQTMTPTEMKALELARYLEEKAQEREDGYYDDENYIKGMAAGFRLAATWIRRDILGEEC